MLKSKILTHPRPSARTKRIGRVFGAVWWQLVGIDKVPSFGRRRLGQVRISFVFGFRLPRLLHVVPVRGHVQDARPPLNAAATTGKYIDNTTNIVTTVVAQSHVCVVTCSRWADAIMVVALLRSYVVACAACRVCRRRRAIMPDAGRKETPGYFLFESIRQKQPKQNRRRFPTVGLLDCWCLN